MNRKERCLRVRYAGAIPVFFDQARETLSQHIARPPLSPKKIDAEENRYATAISFTSHSELFKCMTEAFPVMRFFLELTQHIPTKDRTTT